MLGSFPVCHQEQIESYNIKISTIAVRIFNNDVYTQSLT